MQGTLYAVNKGWQVRQGLASAFLLWAYGLSALRWVESGESVHHLRNGTSSGNRPTAAAGPGSGKECATYCRTRALRSHPRRDPTCRGWPCSQDRGQVRPSVHLAHRCGHSKSPNWRYIMALAWINRLLYLFYEIQLRGKNIYSNGLSYQLHFHAFQSLKLGSYLLKAYHLEQLNVLGQIILWFKSRGGGGWK